MRYALCLLKQTRIAKKTSSLPLLSAEEIMSQPNSQQPTIVKCPTCQNEVVWNTESEFRPFCSKKCQMIDFGEWADEEKSIAGAPDMSDSDGWSSEPY